MLKEVNNIQVKLTKKAVKDSLEYMISKHYSDVLKKARHLQLQHMLNNHK